jgi:hypothetical protein
MGEACYPKCAAFGFRDCSCPAFGRHNEVLIFIVAISNARSTMTRAMAAMVITDLALKGAFVLIWIGAFCYVLIRFVWELVQLRRRTARTTGIVLSVVYRGQRPFGRTQSYCTVTQCRICRQSRY